jgi:ribosome-binding protein aMBF1 (putative translation factor)
MSTWEQAKRRLHAENPRLRQEYERLGPRYETISALVAAREKLGLSQSEVARRMGVRPHVISRLESALHSPRIDTLAAYADALGLRMKVEFARSGASSSGGRSIGSGRTGGPRRRVA